MRGLTAVMSVALIVSPKIWSQGQTQSSGTDVQLRGISAISDKVAWTSGAKGTVLRTIDGGKKWEKVNVPNAEALDFRDIQAFDQNTAFVLSIGPGEQSRIYKTADGGKSWQIQFTNKDPKAFYDCFAFWDNKHGIAVSDSVDGKFPLISTADGETWAPENVKKMPAALPNEGAFAASGTCIATFGKKDVWFGTGGPAARMFHSSDRGENWTVAETPIASGAPSQGVFSVVFWTDKDGMAVGGDYKQPAHADKTCAMTHDGGQTWKLSSHQPLGYRSAVALVAIMGPVLVAAGTNGADEFHSHGEQWQPLDNRDYNAISFASPQAGWAVGPAGLIVRFPALPAIKLSAH
ncbi:MAG: hypothetical protein WA738_10870 [Candidatus Angelobacter sp.]